VNTQTVEAGSIEFAWESGYFTLFPDRCQASIGDLACQLVKQAGGTFRMLAGTDQDTALDVVDAAVPLSIVQAYRSAKVGRGSQLKVRFENTSPGSPIAIPSWAVDLTKKSHRV
jgi:hypothetical protein